MFPECAMKDGNGTDAPVFARAFEGAHSAFDGRLQQLSGVFRLEVEWQRCVLYRIRALDGIVKRTLLNAARVGIAA